MARVPTTVHLITDTGLFMDTDRIGGIGITTVTIVAGTTADATTAEDVITEVVIMVTVPTIIGTIDPALTCDRTPKKNHQPFLSCFAPDKRTRHKDGLRCK